MAIVCSQPAQADATPRQLHGGPIAGGSLLIARDFSVHAAPQAQLAMAITDAWRTFATLELAIGSSVQAPSISFAPGLAIGIAYALDATSVVPWAGLEARAHALVSSSSPADYFVGGGPRVGVDWLFQRYVGLTFQGSYAIGWSGAGLSHHASLGVGLRWTLEL